MGTASRVSTMRIKNASRIPPDHPGDRTVEQADHRSCDADREAELQRGLAAHHQPAEHVDPVLVGAQRIPRAQVGLFCEAQAHRYLVGAIEQRPHEAEQGQQPR